MKQVRRKKQVLAMGMTVLLFINALPAVAFAEGQTVQGLCEHHSEAAMQRQQPALISVKSRIAI